MSTPCWSHRGTKGSWGLRNCTGYRAESEKVSDELKNQWGWTGFSTQDQKCCQILAWIGALVYNWWSLFTQFIMLNRHTEVTTFRPLLLHGVTRQTKHGNQTTLSITSNHAYAEKVERALDSVRQFLQRLPQTAGRFTLTQRWRWCLRLIFATGSKPRIPIRSFYPSLPWSTARFWMTGRSHRVRAKACPQVQKCAPMGTTRSSPIPLIARLRNAITASLRRRWGSSVPLAWKPGQRAALRCHRPSPARTG